MAQYATPSCTASSLRNGPTCAGTWSCEWSGGATLPNPSKDGLNLPAELSEQDPGNHTCPRQGDVRQRIENEGGEDQDAGIRQHPSEHGFAKSKAKGHQRQRHTQDESRKLL